MLSWTIDLRAFCRRQYPTISAIDFFQTRRRHHAPVPALAIRTQVLRRRGGHTRVNPAHGLIYPANVVFCRVSKRHDEPHAWRTRPEQFDGYCNDSTDRRAMRGQRHSDQFASLGQL